ncbi:MAG: DUF5131 family protein [Clostridia bacterium]|nr:DUF5131 family protein [Clostridia bacterium]
MTGETVWNPWHGCRKYSEGCRHCYVYRRDGSVGRDASEITKNQAFDLPVKKNRNGEYKIPSGTVVYACMTSDFFLEEADAWRKEIWSMIRERSDLEFIIITKRIVRFDKCIPEDWGDGYANVSIACTVENQQECDTRLPVFMSAPIKRKLIVCEPLLGHIDMSPYITDEIESVIAGGESGNEARVCNYDHVLDIRRQCIDAGVRFRFKQTGARFLKDGKLYRIERRYQHKQARAAGIDVE